MAYLNLKHCYLSLAGAAAVVFFSIPDDRAYSVSITNAGFEEPILADDGFTDNDVPGWIGTDTSSEGRFGVYNPSSVAFPNEAPEGENIGYLESESLYQTLSETLKANTTYTLSAQIGSSFYDPIEDFSMQLLAGENILAQAIAPVPGDLEFTQVTLGYTALTDNPFLGQLLTIRFVENGSISEGSEVSIDDVRLTATPISEPTTTIGLLITAGMMYKVKGRRKKEEEGTLARLHACTRKKGKRRQKAFMQRAEGIRRHACTRLIEERRKKGSQSLSPYTPHPNHTPFSMLPVPLTRRVKQSWPRYWCCQEDDEMAK